VLFRLEDQAAHGSGGLGFLAVLTAVPLRFPFLTRLCPRHRLTTFRHGLTLSASTYVMNAGAAVDLIGAIAAS